MLVNAEQLQVLIEDIRTRFMPTPSIWRNPEIVAHILREDYGVEGVQDPPSYEVIVREYTPGHWRRRAGDPAIRSGNPMDRLFPRPPTFGEQVLADLDLLRTSPIAALVYVICRSAGVDNRRAIDLGRFASQVTVVLTATTRAGRVATTRAISGSSGQPRDAHLSRAERQAIVDQVGRPRQQQEPPPLRAAAPPSPIPPRRPSGVPTTPPERIRQRLERIERTHGRNTAPVR
jgi:hypothetical protein